MATSDESQKGEPSKISLLDKISDSLASKMDDKQLNLLKLNEMGAIKIEQSKAPAGLLLNKDKTLINVFRGLLKDNDDLAHISDKDLRAMLTFGQQNNRGVDMGLEIPSIFGDSSLSTKDLESLRFFRKDSRDQGDIESALSFISEFHKENNFKFSEEALISTLQVIVPTKAIPLFLNLKRQNLSLKEISQTIFSEFKTSKTMEEFLETIHRITDGNIKDPRLVLEQINILLNEAQDIKSCDAIALNEARRFIKKACGTHVAASIESFLNTSSQKTFREFFRIAKTYFTDELNHTKKIHNIEETI